MKFFAQRLFSGAYMESKDDFLFDTVKNKYREAYGCTNKIRQYIQKEYGQELTSEELLYLTIHIERVVHQT